MKNRRAILNPPAEPRRGCSAIWKLLEIDWNFSKLPRLGDERGADFKIDRYGKWDSLGEVKFATGPRAAESLARFDPPGPGSDTPTPGLGWAGPVRIRVLIGAVLGAGAAPYIFRLLDHVWIMHPSL